MSKTTVTLLDGCSLTINQIQETIKSKKHIDLSEQAWKRVIKSSEAIKNMMADPNKVVYGVTTGFGSFANVSISREDR